MEIVQDLELLKEHIEDAKQFLGVTFGLNKAECLTLIHKVHKTLPEQVKEAVAITRDSERIVAGAREDAGKTVERAQGEAERIKEEARQQAEQIIEIAKKEREQMLQENEIYKLAKVQGEKMRSDAEADAAKVKRGAEDYALHVLFQLENVVGKVAGTIERGRSELQKPGAGALGEGTQPKLP
jgi:cell division septum initiation protein DivIVA